ncbi:Uncharacterised protein [Leclercia adecarboxylata]|uniref:Uncharacterized protein n=1 Tax=Leclercia adecarboxylata TaxID=83655 RepID=A0A4U9HVA9_9ENTR|nr:Uncharacterised protein [Leclercia adecarboxylata]
MLVADPHSPDFNSYASVIDLRTFAAGADMPFPRMMANVARC